MRRVWAGGLLALLTPLAWALPSFDEVRQQTLSSEAVLLDRHGRELQRLRVDMRARRGDWVALQEVSPAVRTALVYSEDRRFYEHSGVDWQSVGAAAWGNLWNSRTRGASTLTMQLAGLLDEDLRMRSGGRSVTQKIGQAITATRLEHGWRKDQILEAYLNRVPFRGEIVGLSALAQVMFGKQPHGLDYREAALAVAMIRTPNASAARLVQRSCSLLKTLQAGGNCAGLEGQVEIALSRLKAVAQSGGSSSVTSIKGDAPHLARKIFGQRRARPGERIASTLDASLQRFAKATLVRHLQEIAHRNVEDGAVVALDNQTGEVLAWVGSSGDLSEAAEVDGVTALRQAGSTLKPFLYAQAIAERRVTAASLLNDAPVNLQTGNGLYIPQNYDRHYKGWVSARTALGASLNIPAVRTLQMVTPRKFARQLQTLELPLKHDGDFYGYSLALGSAEVTLLSLANAYRTLANGGRHGQPVWLRAVQTGTPAASAVSGNGTAVKAQALSAEAAWIVGDMLADRHARVGTFGLDSVLDTRFWSAVKTGTSKDMRDNWCVGFTRRYTVGVWVGNASGASMWGVSGVSGAAPVWHEVLTWLHAREPAVDGKENLPPPGVVRQAIRFAGETEPARDEWFLEGTQQTLMINALARSSDSAGSRQGPKSNARSKLGQGQLAGQELARILAPVDGAIYALDPDIPPARQRVWFEASRKDVTWVLDGKPFGKGPRLSWLPWPGRHRLELRDAAGQVAQVINVEVRGAGAVAGKPPPAAAGQR